MNEPQQHKQLGALTGLRFLAALLVFASHICERYPEFNIDGSNFGLAGVGFFYVLSGFILTYVYAGRRPLNFKDFYRRRIARVWPLHLVTMLIVLFVLLGVEKQFFKPWGWLQFLANVFLLQSWVPDEKWVFSINGPAWSLSVEAFFYLVFPLLLMGGARSLLKKLIAYFVLTMAVLAVFDFAFSEALSVVTTRIIIRANPLFRLYDFCAGMICGFAYLKYSRTISLPYILFGIPRSRWQLLRLSGSAAVVDSYGRPCTRFCNRRFCVCLHIEKEYLE